MIDAIGLIQTPVAPTRTKSIRSLWADVWISLCVTSTQLSTTFLSLPFCRWWWWLMHKGNSGQLTKEKEKCRFCSCMLWAWKWTNSLSLCPSCCCPNWFSLEIQLSTCQVFMATHMLERIDSCEFRRGQEVYQFCILSLASITYSCIKGSFSRGKVRLMKYRVFEWNRD